MRQPVLCVVHRAVCLVAVVAVAVLVGPAEAASRARARPRVAAGEQRRQDEARRHEESRTNRLAEVLVQEERARRRQIAVRQAAAPAMTMPRTASPATGPGTPVTGPLPLDAAADEGLEALFGGGQDGGREVREVTYPAAIAIRTLAEGFRTRPTKARLADTRAVDSRSAAALPVDMGTFHDAYSRFSQGDLEQARAGFERFRDANPGHDMADNAQYWVGECYAAQGRPEAALAAYQLVLDHFPFGDKVADALLKSAYVLIDLGRTEEARGRLEHVVAEFPGTGLASRAAARLAGLDR